MPTAAHVVYIPAMLLLGIVLGWILGGRAARDAEAGRKAREEARLTRQEARRARGTEQDAS